MERFRALLSRLLSYRKRSWELDDYPIRVRRQDVNPDETPGRLVPFLWCAQIIDWWQMAGLGSTREEALTNLRTNFQRFCATHSDLPRPGTSAPIEFATSDLVDKHEELARDFLSRILKLDPEDCLITDESSLWDFHGENSNDEIHQRIRDIYGVDVSEIEGSKLGLIFERIAVNRQQCQGPANTS